MKAEGIGWGKLYIAGEYAVIQPGYPAIILATDRCIHVSIEPSDRFSLISLNSGKSVTFDLFDKADGYYSYAISALRIFFEYLDSRNIDHHPVSVTITSDLDHVDGRKFGLGSSGAIVAAIIKGLNNYFKQTLDTLTLFKLCVISQLRLNVQGSFGDLAAAVYGGVIRYTRFEDINSHLPLNVSLEMEWPKLSIEYIDLPKGLTWIVGWTQQPSSTQSQVEQVRALIFSPQYRDYLVDAKNIVDTMVNSSDAEIFVSGVARYRQWLNQLEKQAKIEIETPLIKTFIRLCEIYGGAGKSSGAGGGDCALAFFSHPIKIDDILVSEGIIPLSIQAASREVV